MRIQPFKIVVHYEDVEKPVWVYPLCPRFPPLGFFNVFVRMHPQFYNILIKVVILGFFSIFRFIWVLSLYNCPKNYYSTICLHQTLFAWPISTVKQLNCSHQSLSNWAVDNLHQWFTHVLNRDYFGILWQLVILTIHRACDYHRYIHKQTVYM